MAEPIFKETYPTLVPVTLMCRAQYEPGLNSGAPPAMDLPAFFLRPGESVLLSLGADGRITAELFGV